MSCIYARVYRDRNPSSSSVLVIIMHHANNDGLSIDRLNKLLKTFYHGRRPTMPLNLATLLGYFKHQERYGTSF